jgi:hypothetical protein
MNKFLCTVIFLLAAIIVHGQELNEKKEAKNEIGIMLTDIVNGAIQLKYERLLGEHISVSLGLGYKGNNGIINLSGLDTDQIKTRDISYSGIKIIPEARYYLNRSGQIGMDGFYFGAYLKYSNYQTDLDGTYINSLEESFPIEFDGDIHITSLGFMVGYKLPLSKKFSLDFLIAGPGSGFYKFKLTNRKDLPDEFYEDLNNALDEYSIFDLIDGDFRFESANSKTKFTRLAFRYGISLGYSF